MPRIARFKIRGAKFLLIREYDDAYDIAFSRYPVWGTAIKQFRGINHINIGENVIESERALISKTKAEELNYTIRLPIKGEDEELSVELQIVEDANLKSLTIEKPEEID